MSRAVDHNLACCHVCRKLNPVDNSHCDFCFSRLHQRKVESRSRSWIYLITAIILFFPANLLPMMYTSKLANTRSDTIFSGIVKLWTEGMQPIATIVFIASIVTPLIKIVIQLYLLSYRPNHKPPVIQTMLYRFIHFIGKWSMVDVFVVALLGSLIQGNLSSVAPGIGVIAFAGVVLFTMMATESFDPRLLWDRHVAIVKQQSTHERTDH